MRVLVACEFSGVVREAFRKLGHDAYSCDLLPSELPSPYHIQGDVLKAISDGWDLLVAHPPCTRLCNSGVRWLAERNLWGELRESAAFFRAFLEAPVERIVVENPIPHKYALELIGRKYDQVIQPYMFGEPESKATCLWLKNLPQLLPTKWVQDRKQRCYLETPSPERWKNRSRTYQGIADALASQYGSSEKPNQVMFQQSLSFDAS